MFASVLVESPEGRDMTRKRSRHFSEQGVLSQGWKRTLAAAVPLALALSHFVAFALAAPAPTRQAADNGSLEGVVTGRAMR